MRDKFDAMGEIEWHVFGSSIFRIKGEEMQSNHFLPQRGITGCKRTFTGPGGRPYRWDVLYDVVVLSRDDGSKTEVARYHRSSLGIVGPKKKARLDVDPDVVHMLDLIILTFVYVEKLRMEMMENVQAEKFTVVVLRGTFAYVNVPIPRILQSERVTISKQ